MTVCSYLSTQVLLRLGTFQIYRREVFFNRGLGPLSLEPLWLGPPKGLLFSIDRNASGLSGDVVRGLVSLAKVQKETDHCVKMGCADSFSSSVFLLVLAVPCLPGT